MLALVTRWARRPVLLRLGDCHDVGSALSGFCRVFHTGARVKLAVGILVTEKQNFREHGWVGGARSYSRSSISVGQPFETEGVVKPAADDPQVRVLVVEDNEPFLQFLCSRVRGHELLELIGWAKDGMDAVRKAELLRPELITMDVGLPRLHGIAAALEIRRFLPSAKILFVTQESEPEVIRECLNLPMCGYVLKPHAGRELLPALDALLAGKTFLSRGLEYCHPSIA